MFGSDNDTGGDIEEALDERSNQFERIAESLEELVDLIEENRSNGSGESDFTPNWEPKRDSTHARILKVVAEIGPTNPKEIREKTNRDHVTRQLTALYRGGYVDRNGNRRSYEYQVTKIGENYLDGVDIPEQNSTDQTKIENGKEPWELAGVSKSNYIAMKLVDEYDGHPRSKDIDARFRKFGYTSQEDIAISPYLSEVHEKGYVGRPESKPYIYWLTEEGKKKLQEGGRANTSLSLG